MDSLFISSSSMVKSRWTIEPPFDSFGFIIAFSTVKHLGLDNLNAHLFPLPNWNKNWEKVSVKKDKVKCAPLEFIK